MNFEESSKRLEDIIKTLEKGTTLEEGVKLFEEGSCLIKDCYKSLDNAKGKITVIREDLDKTIKEDLI